MSDISQEKNKQCKFEYIYKGMSSVTVYIKLALSTCDVKNMRNLLFSREYTDASDVINIKLWKIIYYIFTCIWNHHKHQGWGRRWSQKQNSWAFIYSIFLRFWAKYQIIFPIFYQKMSGRHFHCLPEVINYLIERAKKVISHFLILNFNDIL